MTQRRGPVEESNSMRRVDNPAQRRQLEDNVGDKQSIYSVLKL